MMQKLLYSTLLSILYFHNHLHSAASSKEVDYTPLYSGTLLAYFPENVPPGQLAIEPYEFINFQSGVYDKNWKIQKQNTIKGLSTVLLLETGITNYLDLTLVTNGTYNRVDNRHAFLYGDTEAFLGLQMLKDEKGTWKPDLRFLLGENFPTGKYDKLNPVNLFSDSSGAGSYQTIFVLVTRKIFYFSPKHPFNLNLNLVYTLSNNTNVHGYSIYGGSTDTKGKIDVGDEYLLNLATEFSLTRNWVLGLDMHYQHQNKATFKDIRGDLTNIPNTFFGLPSSEQFSLAPSIEYNYNENFGVLGGAWFTVTGRNSNSFVNYILSVYYEF